MRMVLNADNLRPHGVRRKVLQSDILDLNAAGDRPAIMMPHGGKLLGAWIVMTTAATTADDTIDIGVAKDGDTIIDGYTLAHSGSAIGDVLDIFQTKGTNGGVVEIAAEVIIWVQVAGTGTAGEGYLVVEYEDNSN